MNRQSVDASDPSSEDGCHSSRRLDGWTDERIEQVVGNLLRTGVLIAALVVSIGAVMYLIEHGAERPDYRTFRGEPHDLRSVGLTLQDVTQGNARGIMQLGLLLLIATPIARVALCVIAFLCQRDWLYMVVSFVVLTLLMVGLWW